MKPVISVIIPTFNRLNLLRRCLDLLNRQTIDKQSFEVIVVNDGSGEIQKCLTKSDYLFPIKLFGQVHKGPAAAKNLGIKNAEGEIIVFINDDTLPVKEFIKAHLDLLAVQPECASAGKVIWHPEAQNGKLKKALIYCGIGGKDYNYQRLGECNFRFFCTANIALKKKWLDNEPFDEDFKFAAFEDTELGYRLSRKGLRIFFNNYAVCEHLHFFEAEDLIKRQAIIGESVFIFIKKYPEIKYSFIKKNYKVLTAICFLLGKISLLKKIYPSLYFTALGTYHKYKAFSSCIVQNES